jgi:hypothetical protein
LRVQKYTFFEIKCHFENFCIFAVLEMIDFFFATKTLLFR